MPNWKKLITSGSNATLNSLSIATSITASIISASSGITGSLFGTASFAVSASHVIGLNLSHISTGSITASVDIGTDTFKVQSGSSTFLYVSSSGRVGIGTATPTLGLLQLNASTAIPNANLFINAGTGATGSITVRANNGVSVAGQKIYNPVGGSDSLNFIQLLDADTTTTTNQPIGRIIFTSNDSDSGGTNTTKAFIEAVSEDETPDAFLAFGTAQASSSQVGAVVTERMRITSAGNVGIGTTTTTAKLHISGALSDNLLQVGSPSLTNILFVTGSGRVGIGTSNPAGTFVVDRSGTKIQVDGTGVGIQTTPSDWIHLSTDPSNSQYLRVDAARTSAHPNTYEPGGSFSVDGITGNIENNYALGTPNYWMEIKLDGNVVLIPCYSPA
jgi:hypothetical protein